MSTTGVRVVVRVRPQMENELAAGGKSIAHFDNSGKNVTIDGTRKAAFTFDRAFSPGSAQEEIYTYAAKPIVEDVLKGYNGTIFAYGQTSSGKTHTMEGPDIDGPDRGIIPRIVQNIFQYIEMAPETLEFTVRVSYFEIYMEKIRDLLCDGNDNLQIHENRERGVYVRHATELFMQDPEEVMEVMRSGAERRSVASTHMNDISSRSHSVFLMEINQKDTIKGGMKNGKLYLVDLAGSEKVSKTGADGDVLEEAKNINKSLSALGLVIMSLTESGNRMHVPYRDSKLTRILQESLGGNARTTIIICCSPSSYNEAETLSSLRFGQRAKKIKNNAVVNQTFSAEELQKQLDAAKREIKKLEKKLQGAMAELQIWRSGGTVSEADRVALTAGSDDQAAAAAEAESAAAAAEAAPSGMTEAEREEMMQRETELLDQLDDKDEHIRSLEREIELLGQDKITITKLASENATQRAKIDDLEERIDEILAENTEYEVTIEDMARANNKLEEDYDRTNEEKENLKLDLNALQEETDILVQNVADMVGALAAGSGSSRQVVTPVETGTVIDAQLSKARAYFSQMQTELGNLKKSKEELQDENEKNKLGLEDAESSLSAAKMSISQWQSNFEEVNQRNKALDTEVRELRLKNESLTSEVTDLMDQLVTAGEDLERSKQDKKSDEEVNEIKQALERQRELQRENHTQQLKDLHDKLDTVSQERQEVAYERDKLRLEINQLRGEVEKKTQALAAMSTKMESLTSKFEQSERVERETQGVAEATRQQLEAYDGFKTKMRESILARVRGEKKPVHSEQQSKHVKYLEDSNRQLTQAHQEASKANFALQREIAQLEKQVELKSERITNLEIMIKNTETRLNRQYERHEQSVSRDKRAQRQNVRRKSATIPAQSAPVVRGGAKGAADATKAKFWEDQRKNSTSSPNPARGKIVGQGQPLVGQHAKAAAPTKSVDNNPLDVEYV